MSEEEAIGLYLEALEDVETKQEKLRLYGKTPNSRIPPEFYANFLEEEREKINEQLEYLELRLKLRDG